MKIYKVKINGLIHNNKKTSLTLVNPANNKKDALRGFKTIALSNGLSPDWIKGKNIKESKT